MSKRFTDTNKWRKDFVRSLQAPYKLLWLYILDECDHAGIWHVELDVAGLRIGFNNINEHDAKEYLGDHIIVFDEGRKWFIPDFIDFQYGELNPENRAHKSVIDQILKCKNKGLTWSLQGRKDKDKDKEQDMDMDKDMDKEKEKEIVEKFEIFRTSYPGTKRGHDIEFQNFKKKHKDWREVCLILNDCLAYQMNARAEKHLRGGFVPEWKNLQTYLNNRSWEEIIDTNNISNETDRRNSQRTSAAELTSIVSKHFEVQA